MHVNEIYNVVTLETPFPFGRDLESMIGNVVKETT